MTENADLAALIRTIPDYPKPGILFRDVSTLLLDGKGFQMTIDRLAALVAPDTRLIAGIEARGFIVAAGLSYALGLGKLKPVSYTPLTLPTIFRVLISVFSVSVQQ